MKTLILGASGQLGNGLMKEFPEAVSLGHFKDGRMDGVDFSFPGKLRDKIENIRPEVVINAAAMTNVDVCEKERLLAYTVNALAVRELTAASNDLGFYLVQVSTDYVFDGELGNYKEGSIPNPVNYYGLSKLAGENFAMMGNNSLIVRTSGVFGRSNNFPVYAFETLKKGRVLNVIKGYYSPINAGILAKAISTLINGHHTGVVNVAGDRISRLSLARSIANMFGLDYKLISEVNVLPSMLAKRPFDSSLDIGKAKEMVNFNFHDTEINLRTLVYGGNMQK